MQRCRLILAKLLLLVTLLNTTFIPSVSASPLEDLLGQFGNVKNAEEMNSSGNVKDVLMGLLFGQLLNRILNAPEDVLPGGAKNSGTSGKKEIIGFYAENWASDPAALQSFSAHADTMQTVSPYWGTINADGTITRRDSNNRETLMKQARDQKVKNIVLLNNAKGSGGVVPVHQLLNSSQRRADAIANVEEFVKANGFDGVNIDFELVPPEDREVLTAFMQELSDRLRPQGIIVGMSVFPKKDESTNDVAIAYDYKMLAKYVDQIVLMTYDNHGEWSGPGPVADIRWVEDNLKYALQFIPKHKIYLGIAGYGYDWSKSGVNTVHYSDAMKLANTHNVTVAWDAEAKVPYFTYTDSAGQHQVWFENSRSLSHKLDLVNNYGIKGVALWRLGQEDPGYWQVFREKLR